MVWNLLLLFPAKMTNLFEWIKWPFWGYQNNSLIWIALAISKKLSIDLKFFPWNFIFLLEAYPICPLLNDVIGLNIFLLLVDTLIKLPWLVLFLYLNVSDFLLLESSLLLLIKFGPFRYPFVLSYIHLDFLIFL